MKLIEMTFVARVFARLMPRTYMKRVFKRFPSGVAICEIGTRKDGFASSWEQVVAVGPARSQCRYKLVGTEAKLVQHACMNNAVFDELPEPEWDLVDVDVEEFDAPAWLLEAGWDHIEAYLRQRGLGFTIPALAAAV